MTVKIIDRGPDLDAKIYRSMCVFCGTILEFAGADARNTIGPLQNWKTIACPVCGCEVSANCPHFNGRVGPEE